MAKSEIIQAAVIMGSKSDWETMRAASESSSGSVLRNCRTRKRKNACRRNAAKRSGRTVQNKPSDRNSANTATTDPSAGTATVDITS